MNNINEIRSSYLCNGCGLCSVVCAAKAITMKYDNIGRLQPEINDNSCTNCGLCKRLCPSLDLKGIQLPNDDDPYVGEVRQVFIGRANDEIIYRGSQSGGLVTSILKYLFESVKIDGAIVCKVDFGQELFPKAMLVTSVSDLFLCQKSSYVPVDMVSGINNAAELKSLAVVGIGCHIQGFYALQNFKKEYKEKIKYTLGLICDRTLCRTITEVICNNTFKDKEKCLIWRDKSHGYKEARLLIRTRDGQEKVLPRWHRFVLKDPFTNPRCRICFDKLNVHADIVLGDPWGMNGVDWVNGESVVITRTETGNSIISDMIKSGIVSLRVAPLEEVIKGQIVPKRKETVSAALEVYEEMGWLKPSYGERLLFPHSNIDKANVKSLIESFVADSKRGKEEIVEKNLRYIRKLSIKHTLSKFLYPARLLKRLFK
ncbi:MAG: Coenzyme F420 hydrogenase/dehydrogenase, beta subunit C-terminal domain [Bacteroidales bacterium]|nr:Coenzyme F420 hydrogenase/dehydrogenase, beta subunit C-terminal domain [Bacteroidales bacterium]